MKSNKYKDYLKRTFFRYAAAIILIMVVLFVAFMVANIQFTTVRVNRMCNQKVSDFMKEQYDLFQNAAAELSSDDRVINALSRQDSTSITQANRLLYGFSNAQKLHSGFVLLDRSRKIVCSNLYQDNRITFQASPMIHNVMDKLEDSPSLIYNCVSRLDYNNGQNCDMLFAKAVTARGKIVGYLFFDLQDASIYDFVQSLQIDQVTITDHFDNIIFTTARTVTDPMGKYPTGKYRLNWKNNTTAIYNGKQHYALATTLPGSGIQVYTLTSIEQQRQMFLYGSVFLAIMSLTLVGLVALFTNIVTRRNLSSIDELLAAVEQLGQGNVNYRIAHQSFDEFETLYSSYNTMVTRLQELMERNTRLAEQKWSMELKHLKQQFNPHFVFNVLETLRYEIMIDPQKASEMVVAFANLMRYSIHYGNIKVPLQTDIEYINDYLLLQKMRYNKRLEYHIDIEEALLDYMIPKLLIQPVVENCLNHGAENSKFMRIDIIGRQVDDCIELIVQDNGCGIEAQKLKEILESLQKEEADPSHLGLYYVNRTVQLLYGDSYGLKLESGIDCGTKITLTIPIDREDLNV